MKKYYIIFTVYLLLFSCQEETITDTDYGFLQVESIHTETVESETISRATDEDLIVEIWVDDAIYTEGDKEFRFEAGTFPSTIELPEGEYTLKAFNGAYEAYIKANSTYVEKGEALYNKEEKIVIVQNKATNLNLSVPMVNIGVSLALPKDFFASFKEEGFEFIVSQAITQKESISEESTTEESTSAAEDATSAGATRSISLKDKETAYFDVKAFNYLLKALNNDYEPKELSGSHKEVVGGTIYTVTYSFDTRSFVFE